MTDIQRKQTSTSNTEAQHPALVKNEVKPDLNLEGDISLNDLRERDISLNDLRIDVPASPKTIDAVADWTSKEKEKTRTHIAMWLVRMLVVSTAAIGLLIGLAVFNPNADKAFIKEMIPLVLPPQATLVGVAIGYYFGATKEK